MGGLESAFVAKNEILRCAQDNRDRWLGVFWWFNVVVRRSLHIDENAPPLPSGDHKGPPNLSLPHSPLRNMVLELRLFARDDIGFKAFIPALLQFGVTMVLV